MDLRMSESRVSFCELNSRREFPTVETRGNACPGRDYGTGIMFWNRWFYNERVLTTGVQPELKGRSSLSMIVKTNASKNNSKETKSMESIQVTTNAKKKQEKGVTTVEYAVMLVLVAIAVLAFGSGIANSVTGVFSRLASSLG
jgi:Flp pilus assembly pilin Flp